MIPSPGARCQSNLKFIVPKFYWNCPEVIGSSSVTQLAAGSVLVDSEALVIRMIFWKVVIEFHFRPRHRYIYHVHSHMIRS
jgi:hypothetical protein